MGSRSIVGAALVWTACASAQELRLEELVSAALHSNAEILAAQKRYEAARQRPSQAASLPDPTFSPGWSSAGNPLPGAGLGTNPMSNIGFAVTQEIPYPGKQRLRGNIAAKEADVQFEELQLVQLGVISRVKQAFFRLHHAYSGREVLERNRELLKQLLAITEVRYAAGKAAQQDVFKAQVQISLLETKLEQADRERRLRQAELNSLLNRAPDAALARPAEPRIMPIAKTLAELQAAAQATSPLRMRDQKMTERAELAVNLARKDYFPDTALSGGYYNQAGMAPFYSFRADIKIPLYSRTKQRAAVTEQAELLAGARHQYEATAHAMNFRIADDYSMAETSARLIELYLKTILPQAQLAVTSSVNAYGTGAIDFLSVLNNYMAVLEYEMSYHEEMQNFHLALSRLEEATGVSLIEVHALTEVHP